MEKKFNLIEATPEDTKLFRDGMNELCDKLGLVFNVSINKVVLNIKNEDGTLKNVFVEEPSIVLQKKVEIPDTSEPEAPKVVDVEATPTVSPFVAQPSTDENNTTA